MVVELMLQPWKNMKKPSETSVSDGYSDGRQLSKKTRRKDFSTIRPERSEVPAVENVGTVEAVGTLPQF